MQLVSVARPCCAGQRAACQRDDEKPAHRPHHRVTSSDQGPSPRYPDCIALPECHDDELHFQYKK